MRLTQTFTKFSLAALSAAALVACGGGDDNEAPPIPLSSECALPTGEVHATSQYSLSFSDGARALSTVDEYLNEPVEYHGQKVLRAREIKRTTYSAPADMVGQIHYEWAEEYYTLDDKGNRHILGDVYSHNWESETPVDDTYTSHFDPARVEGHFDALEPGQTAVSTVTGTEIITAQGESTNAVLNYTERVQYMGQEVTAVPAGAKTACKFVLTGIPGGVTTPTNVTVTLWHEKGTGLPVRFEMRSGASWADAQLVSTTGYR